MNEHRAPNLRKWPLALLAGLALVTLPAGCGPSFFSSLFNTTVVYASVANNGAAMGFVNWTFSQGTAGQPGVVNGVLETSTVVDPQINLLLQQGSAPVTLDTVQAIYSQPENGAAVGDISSPLIDGNGALVGFQVITSLTPVSYGVNYYLTNESLQPGTMPTPTTVTLGGLITQEVINYSLNAVTPNASPSSTALSAVVQLTGHNSFGRKVYTNINVPIEFSYAGTPPQAP